MSPDTLDFMRKIGFVRKDYANAPLEKGHLDLSPHKQLQTWLDTARDLGIDEFNAMSLATVSPQGRPSVRIVLMRGIDERGLRFFTNYESTKAKHLAQNPNAEACFWWGVLNRQVRVSGTVERLSEAESTAYFATRPYENQVAAMASTQSSILKSREDLEAEMARVRKSYPSAVPKPEHWGGFLLVPDRFEFWSGRPSRAHDRFQYLLVGDSWVIERLSP